jgi:hypothetical protein
VLNPIAALSITFALTIYDSQIIIDIPFYNNW